MHRLLCLILAGVVGLVVVGSAAGDAPPGQRAAADRVFGVGTVDFDFDFRVGFTVFAQSGPVGETPRGTITITSAGGGLAVADATCVRVVGSRAWVSGPLRFLHSQFPLPPQNAAMVILEDMPEPQPDRVALSTFASSFGFDPSTLCLFPFEHWTMTPLAVGFAYVHDGSQAQPSEP